MATFEQLVRYVMDAHNTRSITIGGVEFFVDADGPFAGQLAHDLPTSAWDLPRVSADLSLRLALLNALPPERC